MENFDLESIKELVNEAALKYVPRLAVGLVILFVGWWLINRTVKTLKKVLMRRDMDPLLVPFTVGAITITLKILLIAGVATLWGFAATGIVTALGAAGLAVGLALQGSLSNFAGGVLILLFKPFKVDDLVTINDSLGTVKSISLLYTVLSTLDDNTALIPNGVVANTKILNYTKENNRRIDLEVGIAYREDFETAKRVLEEAMSKVPGVLQDPPPFVGIMNFGDSSVNLAVRPFCMSVDYIDVLFRCNAAIKKALNEADIEIPFPQRDLNIKGGIMPS